MRRMEGKVVFITGIARGQGRNHAIRFAKEGANIIGLDLCDSVDDVPYEGPSKADLECTVVEVEKAGGKIIADVADVRQLSEVEELVAKGLKEFGSIDTVIANAGICTFGSVTSMTESMFRTMIDINLTGVWITARAAVPHMISAGKGGAFIITSSTAGLKGHDGIAHYSAAKHGVVGLMKSMANELAPNMIRVNTVHPTNVDTDMIQNLGTWSRFLPQEDSPTKEQFRQASTQYNALPVPWLELDDISNVMLFLASDEARYITGISMPVDAGALGK